MKPSISRGLGALTPDTWREIYQTVENGKAGEGTRESGSFQRFTAKIDSSAIVTAGTAIWRYAWTEVRLATSTSASFSTVTGGRSGTTTTGYAINLLEMANTSSVAYGYSVTSLELNDSQDFYIGAVPAGTIVEIIMRRATDGSLGYEFIAPNRIYGTCPVGLVQELDGGEYGAT